MVAKSEISDLPQSVRKIIGPIEDTMYVVSGKCDPAAIADDIFQGGLRHMLKKPAEYKPLFESLTRALGNPIFPQTEASELEEAEVNFSFCLIAAEELQRENEKALVTPGIREFKTTVETQIIAFINRLQDLHNEDSIAISRLTSKIMEKKGQSATWTAILASLKSANPGITDSINQIIVQSNLPLKHRQILLDKRPGKIYRAKSGEIKFTNQNLPENASLVYTSSYREPEIQAVNQRIESEETTVFEHCQEAKREKIPVAGKVNLRVFGEAAIPQIEAVPSLIDNVFQGKELDEDTLFDEVFGKEDSLSKKWKKMYRPERDGKDLMFPSVLNEIIPAVAEAKKLGIIGVKITGKHVVFVLEGQAEENIISLQGYLEDDGELKIDGIDSLESRNLFLNRLALSLATMEVYSKGIRINEDTTIEKSSLYSLLARWNTTRNSFSELVWKVGGVVASVGEYPKGILVSERR